VRYTVTVEGTPDRRVLVQAAKMVIAKAKEAGKEVAAASDGERRQTGDQ
jgi:hypothetical protein